MIQDCKIKCAQRIRFHHEATKYCSFQSTQKLKELIGSAILNTHRGNIDMVTHSLEGFLKNSKKLFILVGNVLHDKRSNMLLNIICNMFNYSVTAKRNILI